jgi:hypothetical protein
MISRRNRFALAAGLAALAVSSCGGSTRAGHAPRSNPIDYLPGGDRRIAWQPVPGVGTLAIYAERYRFEGRVYLDLAYQFHEPGGASGGSSVHTNGAGLLSWTFGGECPRAGAIAAVAVLGLLRAPDDVVLAYAGHRFHRLHTASIPAYLHPGGVAAYAVLDEPPERLLVRTPTGRTVMSEQLERAGPTRCRTASSIMYLESRAKSRSG